MKELPDGHRALEPPDTISNSEVKRCIADGSVGSPHVRVGHRQAPKQRPPSRVAFFCLGFYELLLPPDETRRSMCTKKQSLPLLGTDLHARTIGVAVGVPNVPKVLSSRKQKLASSAL